MVAAYKYIVCVKTLPPHQLSIVIHLGVDNEYSSW